MAITLDGTNGIQSTGIDEDSSGNVGIGTSSPKRVFQVNQPTSSTEMILSTDNSSGGAIINVCDVDGNNGANYTLRLRGLNSAGTVPATLSKIYLDATTVEVLGKLSGDSVPSGSVIQTKWNNFTSGASGSGAFSVVWLGANFRYNITPQYSDSKILCMVSTGLNLICDGRVYLRRSTDGGSNWTVINSQWQSFEQRNQFL